MKKICLPLLLALTAASAAHAAPFAITYSGGSASNSSHPDVPNGTPFSVTFIVDNGGTTAAGQTWTLADLTCTLWHIGSGAQRTTFTHPLNDPAQQLSYGSGAVITNAGGTGLTFMLDAGSYAIPLGQYSVSGPADLAAPVSWNVDGNTTALADAQGSFDGAGGGVPTDPALWSAPIRVTGPCDDTPFNAPPPPPPGPGNVASVPALGAPALALLCTGAAGLGAWRLRRRETSK